MTRLLLWQAVSGVWVDKLSVFWEASWSLSLYTSIRGRRMIRKGICTDWIVLDILFATSPGIKG
jgi:hypothetical protein